jgi:hypothetical protein
MLIVCTYVHSQVLPGRNWRYVGRYRLLGCMAYFPPSDLRIRAHSKEGDIARWNCRYSCEYLTRSLPDIGVQDPLCSFHAKRWIRDDIQSFIGYAVEYRGDRQTSIYCLVLL